MIGIAVAIGLLVGAAWGVWVVVLVKHGVPHEALSFLGLMEALFMGAGLTWGSPPVKGGIFAFAACTVLTIAIGVRLPSVKRRFVAIERQNSEPSA